MKEMSAYFADNNNIVGHEGKSGILIVEGNLGHKAFMAFLLHT